MKTLTELKRTLKPGTRIRCIENTYRPELNGKLRLVTRTQTNGFYWMADDAMKESWTPYCKASLFKFDGNAFQFSLGRGDHHVKLEIIETT